MSFRRIAIVTALVTAAAALVSAAPARAVGQSCTSIDPDEVTRGVSNQVVHLHGNYPAPTPPETVSISPPTGITIVSTTKVSSSLIDIVVNVAPDAPTTPRDVSVHQVTTATCTEKLHVGPVSTGNPIVTSISPEQGQGDTVVEVTDLKGNDFSDNPQVRLERTGFDPIPMTEVNRVSTTKITGKFDLADAAPGRWSVRVTNSNGGSTVLPNAFNVVLPPPTVEDVTPTNIAQTAESVKLTITGTGFAKGFQLVLPDADGVTLSEITRVSKTVIEAKAAVTENAPLGSRDVRVTNADLKVGECPACFFVVDGPQRNPLSEFNAYGTFNRGGYVAAGDLDGDPTNGAELVTGANAGGSPHVQVFRINPATGQRAELFGFHAYDSAFIGGVRVAVGELDGDPGNGAEIVTSPGPGGGPHVRIFKVDPGNLALSEPLGGGFMAFSPLFGGGAYLATADVDGDARDEVVVGAGPGGGPHVRIMKYDETLRDFVELAGFYAYAQGFSGGVAVAGGNVVEEAGPDQVEAITAPASGGGPHVRLFDERGLAVREFMAFSPSYTEGVRLASGDLDFDTVDDVIVAKGSGPDVALFTDEGTKGFNPLVDPPIQPYGPNFVFGVNVASFDMDGDGDDDVVTAPDRDSIVQVRILRPV